MLNHSPTASPPQQTAGVGVSYVSSSTAQVGGAESAIRLQPFSRSKGLPISSVKLRAESASPRRTPDSSLPPLPSRTKQSKAPWVRGCILLVGCLTINLNANIILRNVSLCQLCSPITPPEASVQPAMEAEDENFYGEDECFVPGNGVTKYRFPTKTFTEKNIPHSEEEPSLVVGVLSNAYNPHDRVKIRHSWAAGHSNVFFLVSGNWTASLEQEFKEYNDLIFSDAPETYRGVTLKVMVLLAAVNKHLPKAMVIKTDDDSYVRMTEMAKLTRTHHNEMSYRGGGCPRGKVLREKGHPWYISPDLYPKDKYPHYALGGGYMLSASANQCAVQQMHQHIRDTEVFPVEDAFVGILLHEGCPHVQCTSHHHFQTSSRRASRGVWVPDQVNKYAILHTVKSYELMLQMHDVACCEPRNDFDVDSVSCAHAICPTTLAN